MYFVNGNPKANVTRKIIGSSLPGYLLSVGANRQDESLRGQQYDMDIKSLWRKTMVKYNL